MVNGILKWLSDGYVDHLISFGDCAFKKLCEKINARFEILDGQILPCSFTGFSLRCNKDNEVVQDQHDYIKKFEKLPIDASYSNFRSMIMRLAWHSNTIPDFSFKISQLAQVPEDMFNAYSKQYTRRLNRGITFTLKSQITIRIPKMRNDLLRIVCHSGPSVANNHDLTSQLGHIVIFTDQTGSDIQFAYRAYKSRRVKRSAMAGEVIAFSDLFDVSITISLYLSRLFGRRIPVQFHTNGKYLFDVISKGSRTSEKRMILEIAAARECLRTEIISDIGFICSYSKVADVQIKHMHHRALQ